MSKGSSAKDLSVFESEWFDSKENIQEPESLKSVVLNLLQKSSIYALSQLVTSSGFGRRILWLIVLLVGLSGCTYEIYNFLTLYFQYPVVITLEVKNNWKLDFPAVTICNLNRIPNEQYQCLLSNISPEECLPKQKKKVRPIITDRNKFASCSKDSNGTFSAERSRILSFLNKYLQLDEDSRSKYGYSRNDLITSCSFNGESCSIGNFSAVSSIQFGNCFTFNGILNENESLETPYIGPNSGLEISISLNRNSYSPITSSIGARVIIHESNVEPNSEDHGINISPGYETSVALQETSIYRLPDPYRDQCRQYGGNIPSERNQASCIANCMQNINLHECGCLDPFIPTDSSTPLCDLRNQTTVCCLDDVMELFSEDNVSCSCPLPCKSTDYEMTISTAEWPSKRFFDQFLKEDYIRDHPINRKTKVKKAFNFVSNMLVNITLDDSIDCPTKCSSEKKDFFEDHRQNVAKLKVFYKSLEKISYKQEPMFQDSELFSQLGGQLGLWLGISLVALFECVENVSHLIHYFIKKVGKPRNTNVPYFQSGEFDKITKV